MLLCDISGSMDRYSRLLLQFVHTVRHSVGRVEAFVFGTRLTRVTTELAGRDAEGALARAGAVVNDWAGGTRIGESLRTLNCEHGGRVVSRFRIGQRGKNPIEFSGFCILNHAVEYYPGCYRLSNRSLSKKCQKGESR